MSKVLRIATNTVRGIGGVILHPSLKVVFGIGGLFIATAAGLPSQFFPLWLSRDYAPAWNKVNEKR